MFPPQKPSRLRDHGPRREQRGTNLPHAIGTDFVVEVLGVSELRGPAAVAQKLYRETDASRELRLKLAEERKTMPHSDMWRERKPSKRDRREIDRFRGRG